MKSLYFRVFLITIAVILVSSTLGFLASNIYYHLKLKPYNDEKLTGIAEQMKQYIESEPEQMDKYLRNAASLGYEIYVTDEQGNSQFYGSNFRERDLDQQAVDLVFGGEVYHGVAQFPNKPFISGFFENRLSNTIGLLVQFPTTKYALFMRPDVLLQFGELRTFFALVGLLTVIISILIFLISTRYLVKPITRLSDATKRISQGHYNLRLPTRRRDEIGQLASHFMTMSRELDRVDQARQQFVSNVSHEIQSPLTSIQGFAQILAKHELSTAERAHYISVIEAESRHLSMLSKQLLMLSSLEQGEDALNKQRIVLHTHVRQAVQVLQWQLEEKELLLKLSIPPTATIYGDEVLFMQVWMNLIANAVSHIPTGRSIEIVAEQTASHTVIIVADTGDGIAPEHLPFLFDRFYRVDRARERTSGRTGLGLAIVKKIVQLHDGQIDVSSSRETGTTFTVTLPNL
ncbi:signal transduction histidine kinase [Paenibacillus cellulosilyticus]|uniref:Heme sensor protein HssS n=1 Tax=Paenibacillus cellulosilyticus TaxID=375489 RepID=A0A2V2Z2Q1_9BACL|nr:HAMP domain-containing sensor histidine kinase [Paenibacillus cellulosilyticus]PWW02931.1 signal transduction histidine kinase [Paenibacillus cellulosilyticus]QKS45839.1 HAMP domain-containing protein [Paenibacillus cellulosilyticus]